MNDVRPHDHHSSSHARDHDHYNNDGDILCYAKRLKVGLRQEGGGIDISCFDYVK
ncbi:hypothetical protein [Geomicrobium sp. JCM 19055]|uniref:hypothetical protein n=1 Tax=Geomicrobium sp. JCM 19055 TaxID=1460649 RepID=UPI002236AD41|nr:hypothetical protein [Geomicrobium sp. JCM 19055]